MAGNVRSQYLKIRQHIVDIARNCGRDPSSITLVAVSKGYAWDHVAPAYEQGCRDFGENRVQEALEKMASAPSDIRWHMIGNLQMNKVRKVVGKFALIHSVDSFELAQKIASVSAEMGLVTPILLEANTSGEQSKHGLTSEDWQRLFPSLQRLPTLQIQGLMTMAPLTEDQQVIRTCFARLRELRDALASQNRCILPHLSMGMSHDYPIAIEEGATLLRIGTAIFN